MIVQCGQCNTKFRLDDAKIKETGVKVRCSKCRHIFMIYRETRQEDSDFDRLLSGLNTATAATATEEAQPSLSPSVVAPSETVADVEPVPTPTLGSDEWQIESATGAGEIPAVPGDEFDFSFPPPEEEETAATVDKSFPQEETWGEGLSEGFDFSEQQEEVQQSASAESVSGDVGDFPIQDSSEPPVAEFQFADAGSESGEGVGGEETTGFVDKPAEDRFFLELQEGEAAAIRSDTQESPFPISEADQAAAGFASPESAESFAAAGASKVVIEPAEKIAEGVVPAEVGVSEDLPPLPISSRRVSPNIPVVVVAVSILFVIILAGVGFYFFSEGPDALNKIGLGQFAKWAGLETAEEGKITLRNTTAAYIVNKEAGELVVVSGDAVNDYRKPRASIQIRALLFGPKGEVLMRKIAYCGNKLTKEQLASLPLSKIETAMNNQFGDSLCNLGVAPGKSIPFVAVFSKVPKEAAEYGVEVAGSTVASQ